MNRSFVLAVFTGLLFGAGLLVSGMTQPAKVVGFLDVTRWDPSLAFVMAGAIAVYLPAYRRIMRRRDPWFDGKFHVPDKRHVDTPLVAGAAIFGIGWGLSGICPGPGIVNAAAGSTMGIVFVLAMLVGMMLQHAAQKRP